LASRLSVDQVVEAFRREFGREPEIVVSAPARLDLLNSYQDRVGLPVVSVGIDLRCFVAVARSRTGLVEVVSENLRREKRLYRDVFNPIEPEIIPNWFGSYVRAAYVAMSRYLSYSPPPAEILVYSEVPIGSGLGSSSALEVATVYALSKLGGFGLDLMEIAEIGYVAEHNVLNAPCGRQDHYTSTFGGVLLVRTRPPYRVEKLVENLEGVFIAIDSGERYITGEILSQRIFEIDAGLKNLLSMSDLPEDLREIVRDATSTRWERLDEDELRPYLERLSPTFRKRILYVLRCHRSTMATVEILMGRKVDREVLARALSMSVDEVEKLLSSENPRLAVLARTMNHQHELLRDLYELTTEKLENIREATLRAGALACKMSGAGMGGALAALAKNLREAEEIAQAVLVVGGSIATPVNISTGLRQEL